MPKPPDPDKIAAAARARATGESFRSIAERLGVAEGTVRAWLKRVPPVPPVPPVPMAASAAAAPVASPPDLSAALATLADELESIGEAGRAAIVRQAIDAIIPEEFDALSYLRKLVRRTERQLDVAEAAGQINRSAQLLSNLQKMMPTLKTLERQDSADTDAVTVQRSEIEAAKVKVAERLGLLAAQPLTCSRCGAELRMQLALTEAGLEESSPPASASP